MRVFVKTKTTLYINGQPYVYEPGEYDLDEDKARILISSGYAIRIEDQKPKRKKDDNAN